MKNLWMLLLVSWGSLLGSSLASAQEEAEKFDASGERIVHGTQGMVQNRVYQLPEDQGKFYVTVVTTSSKPSQFERNLKSWFDSDWRLKALKDQTHFTPYTDQHVMYRERFAKSVGQVPAVILQDASGKILYKATGVNIPRTSEGLAAAMWNRCPQPRQPTPGPATPLPPEVPPDQTPALPDTVAPTPVPVPLSPADSPGNRLEWYLGEFIAVIVLPVAAILALLAGGTVCLIVKWLKLTRGA